MIFLLLFIYLLISIYLAKEAYFCKIEKPILFGFYWPIILIGFIIYFGSKWKFYLLILRSLK